MIDRFRLWRPPAGKPVIRLAKLSLSRVARAFVQQEADGPRVVPSRIPPPQKSPRVAGAFRDERVLRDNHRVPRPTPSNHLGLEFGYLHSTPHSTTPIRSRRPGVVLAACPNDETSHLGGGEGRSKGPNSECAERKQEELAKDPASLSRRLASRSAVMVPRIRSRSSAALAFLADDDLSLFISHELLPTDAARAQDFADWPWRDGERLLR
ncbi:hypothetical protein LX36DRAFT_659497 [Colletotrichum falcatum]|nr:hypothetical protein LX36DRAFT_659497 [Colletotrichum falcatum]